MMKKIIAIILLLGMSSTFSFALEKEEIASKMASKIDQATLILLDDSIDKKQKAQKIFPLFDEVFDYELMAKLALGKKNWLSFSSSQQEKFTQQFLNYLKRSYMDKMDLYSGEKVHIVRTDDINPQRTYLVTELVGEKEDYEIIYKFYASNGQWKIYDLDILGVSLIQTYRAQFDDILEQGDFQALMDKLETQTE